MGRGPAGRVRHHRPRATVTGPMPSLSYPSAHRLELVEELHGHLVADPYRWLEDADDPATVTWSDAQDVLARAILGALPGRQGLQRRLHELMPGFQGPPLVIG